MCVLSCQNLQPLRSPEKVYSNRGARPVRRSWTHLFLYNVLYSFIFFNLKKKANFFSISPSVTPDKSFTWKCLYFQRWTIEVASHRCPELAPLYNRRDQWPWTVYLNIHHLTKTNNSARWCARNLLQTDGLRMTWPCAESNRWWNRGWD